MATTQDAQLVESIVAKSRSVTIPGMATSDVCGPVLAHAIERLGCQVADVWSVDPRRRKLILVATRCHQGRSPLSRIDVLPVDTSLTGDVVETKRITCFDLDEHRSDARTFQDIQLRKLFGVDTMLSVPVLNTSNPHQVLCVLNFLPERSQPFSSGTIRLLKAMASVLGAAIEGSLRERAYRVSMMLGQQLGVREENELDPFLTIPVACEILAACCLKALRAARVAIYLKDAVQGVLTVKAVVIENDGRGISQNLIDQAAQSRIPAQVENVVRSNREYLAPRVSDEANPAEFVEGPISEMKDPSCVLVPVQDLRGRCLGVIHCIRDADDTGSINARFSYDDIAILEAICQSFLSPLETLLESERRRFSQQKLSHELRVPVTTFRAMLSKMQEECKSQRFRFQYPHFKEGLIYTDLMIRLLKELDIVRFGPSNIPLRIHATNVQTEVVIPALRFTIPVLRERRFFTWQFSYSGLDEFPKLFVDPALITQVVFNLLDNAIKYYDGPARDFRCAITGQIADQFFEIAVSDNGPGIDVNQADTVFKYGQRGKNRRANAFGEGLGLWISKAIARRHQGDLFIRKYRDRTTFVFQLPRSIALPPRDYHE